MRINITNKTDIGYSFYNPKNNCLMQVAGSAAHFCLTSKIFNLLTLGILHTFIHEFGHALTYQILTGGEATINLSTASCYGSTTLHSVKKSPSTAEATLIDLAGPLADIIFSITLIVGVFALTHYIHMPQGLSLGLRIGIGAPSVFWIVGEFFYAAVSACQKDDGDFGKIACRGWSHLFIAVALLVGICAVSTVGLAFLL